MKGGSSEEPALPRALRRDAGAPFDDLRVEQFAKARAKGGTIAASGSAAGVAKPTALRWESHPEVRARVRELRDGAEDFIGVSKAYVFTQLRINVERAREDGHYKSSNEALLMMYKMIQEDKGAAHQMASAKMPATLEGQQLQHALKAHFSEPQHVVEVAPEPPEPPEAPPEPEEQDGEEA